MTTPPRPAAGLPVMIATASAALAAIGAIGAGVVVASRRSGEAARPGTVVHRAGQVFPSAAPVPVDPVAADPVAVDPLAVDLLAVDPLAVDPLVMASPPRACHAPAAPDLVGPCHGAAAREAMGEGARSLKRGETARYLRRIALQRGYVTKMAEHLACETGVSAGTLKRILNSDREPSLDTFVALAAAYPGFFAAVTRED